MPKIPFTKYHGAGNDFILIDDRAGTLGPILSEEWIAKTCHRRFGIGADGLILLQTSNEGADFFMKYYNADGRTSTFCGNGGRCIVSFAHKLGIHNGECKFLGTDGWHSGKLTADGNVCITMTDVEEVQLVKPETYVLYTGSPHYVALVDSLDNMDVREAGATIRYSPDFAKEGINVNFIESLGVDELRIRTYERGVEDETMACGTGVVAAAISNAVFTNDYSGRSIVHAAGGDLLVEFTRDGEHEFRNVFLSGPAKAVFEGEIEV